MTNTTDDKNKSAIIENWTLSQSLNELKAIQPKMVRHKELLADCHIKVKRIISHIEEILGTTTGISTEWDRELEKLKEA